MANKRSVGVRLRLWLDSYRQDAAEAKRLNQGIGESGKKAKAGLDEMAGTLTIVGGLLVAAAGAAIVTTAKFDKAMSEVGAVAGAAGEQLNELREAAIKAGEETAFSASEAATAEAELAKAGVVTADILGGALSGALDLAAAGTLELGTAAEISAKTMNAFGLKGADVGHIADVLAAAANKSATSVEELGIGLQQVGLVANQVGLSMEETVALLAAFADRGLAGSDGATSLKTALLRLAAPLGDAKELMDQLGISLYDSNGNMVDAATIAGQLQDGMKDLSAEERNAALNTIFGADAIRAANVLYGLGEDGVREYTKAVDDQGAASEVAAAKLDNLAGDVEALGGSVETLLIKSGEGAMGPLRFLTQWATDSVNAFGALPGPVQGTVTAFVGLTGVALLGAAAAIKLRSGLATMATQLAATGTAGALAGRGLQAVVGFGSKALGVIAALSLAEAALNQAFGDEKVPTQMEAFAKGLEKWAANGEVAGEVARVLGPDLDTLTQAFKDMKDPSAGFQKFLSSIPVVGIQRTGATFEEAAQALGDVDSALAQLVQGGKSAAAADLFEQLTEVAQEQGVSLDELKAALPQYAAALETAGDAAGEQADPTADLAAQNVALAGAFGDAANEADGLKDAFDGLNGTMLDMRAANRDAEAAVDALTDALEKSNGSMDITTEEGRDAEAALDGLAEAARDVMQTTYDQTGSVEAANAAYEDYIGQLKQVLRNAGYSEDAINDLINKIAKVPTYKAITFDTRVNVGWGNLFSGFASLPYNLVAAITRSLSFAQGGVVEHAAGGLLNEAMSFTSGSSPLYAFAEPETGGEAFVPRRGNYSRSMGILSQAAGWYNADVVPRGTMATGGGGSSMVDVRVSVAPGADGALGRAIQDMLRVDVVQVGGGSVQDRYGQRGRY